jgi:hypothetical protein
VKSPRFRKPKAMFSLICGIEAQNKYKQYYIYIKIYTEHAVKSGTGRGDQRRKKIWKGRELVTKKYIMSLC